MEMTWADRIAHEARESALKEGIEKGLERGLETGLQKGLQKGLEKGKRDLLLEQLERRFGPLPEATVKRVQALTSPEELSRLAARLLDAPSLDDLGL